MKLKVNSDKSIAEIQNEFNSLFPYLRIEFPSNRESGSGDSSPSRSPLNKSSIGDLRPGQKAGRLEISENVTIAELKRMFKAEFGLIVRIYRKSDNFWLETNLTDKLTVAQQNQHGKDLSEG